MFEPGQIVKLYNPKWEKEYRAEVIKVSDFNTLIVKLDCGSLAKVSESVVFNFSH